MKLQVIILGLIELACPLVLAAGAAYHIPHANDMWDANPIYYGHLINENTNIRICLNQPAADGTTFKVYLSSRVYFIGGVPDHSMYFPVPNNTDLHDGVEYAMTGLNEVKLKADAPFLLVIEEATIESASIWVTIDGAFLNPVKLEGY